MAAATIQASDPSTPHDYTETNNGAMSPDALEALAANLDGASSLLDGLSQPIDLALVDYNIYTAVFQDLANLANYLGYGWVAGVNGQYVGQDYHYVAPGATGLANGFHTVTGPGFEPNMNGNASGYMNQKRCSIEFISPRMTYSDPVFDQSSLRWVDAPASTDIVQFEVDNLVGTTPVTSTFNCEYFRTGQAGAATQKSWQNGWNWQLSSTQTFNSGAAEAMFAKFSISVTESGGMTGSTGGNSSTTSSISQGTQETMTFSKATDAYTKGVYAVRTQSGTAAINFSCTATLEFGVRFFGFLRWGGGHAFTGSTNYHNTYSGSGDRPTMDFSLGDATTPWWSALKQAITTNASPWAWDKMAANYGIAGWLDGLASGGAQRCTFPIAGVTASMQRQTANWVTVSQEVAGDNDPGPDGAVAPGHGPAAA